MAEGKQPAPENAPVLPAALEAAFYAACGAADAASAFTALLAAHPAHAAALRRLQAAHARAVTGLSALRDTVLPAAHSSGLAPGDVVSAYRIVRELGRGGFGVVWLAEQQEPLRREVALKVLGEASSGPEVLRRFTAERHVLASFDHPGIAGILDAGSTADGRPWFVMDYVPGEPITLFADRRRIGIDARLELFLAVCAAVQHAHQRGVLHRDLKPGNVLVVEQDERPVPKVIDFGLAKALRPETAMGAVGTTEIGRLLGTPEYMSPEQAAGQALDTRSDVYSLGAMLFELLTGNLPFAAERLRAQGLASVVRILAEVDAPAPSSVLADATAPARARARSTTPAALRTRLRGELDWISAACLCKDKERRYAGVAELAADVRRHLGNRPLSVGPPRPSYLLRKFMARHRAGVAAALIAALALVAAGVLTLWSLVRVTEARDLAEDNAYVGAIAAARGAADAERGGEMRRHLERAKVDHRHVEWQLLAAQTEDASVTVPAPGGSPMVLAATARIVVIADQETFIVCVLDAADGRRVAEWREPALVRAMAASPDGALVAVGFRDGHVALRATSDFRQTAELQTGARDLWALAFLPGGQLLAGVDDLLVVVDPATGVPGQRLAGHRGNVVAVAGAPDGDTLASGSSDGDVRLWSRSGGTCLGVLPHDGSVRQVCFDPSGRTLATAGHDGQLRLWDVGSRRLVARQSLHTGVCSALAFSPDGSRLATGQWEGIVRWWDGRTLADLGAARGHDAYVGRLCFLGDGRLVTISWDGTVRFWPAEPPERVGRLTGMLGTPVRFARHPTRPWLAGGSLAGELAMWDLSTRRLLWKQKLFGFVLGIAFLDSDRVLVGGDAPHLLVRSAADGRELAELPLPGAGVNDLALVPERREIALALDDGSVQMVATDTLAPGRRITPRGAALVGPGYRIVVDPSGGFAATAATDGRLRMFDLEHGAPLWERAELHATAAAWSPDGRTLWVGSTLGWIFELDGRSGAERRRFGKGKMFFGVTSMLLTRDGRRLITGGEQFRIWDTASGAELLALAGRRFPPGAFLLDDEQHVLVTGGGFFTEPAEILLWPLAPLATPR